MRKPWTENELQVLRLRYPEEKASAIAEDLGRSIAQIYSKAQSLGLKKSPAFMASKESGRLNGTEVSSLSGRFAKGSEPWNKGKSMPSNPRCEATQFKPGNRPHTWNPIGHERITRDGYTERKVTDTGVTRKDYVAVHRLIWEKHHGPIPKGHVIVFKDKDPKNLVIENLEMISRQELARRNTIHRYPKEVADAIRHVSGLRRRIKNLEKKRSAQ